jgi:hypothetical protein
MPHTLVKNIDFFVAALSQTYVSAMQLDPDGMYSRVGFGVIEKFSEGYVRLVGFDGAISHYDRETTKFQRDKG